jgi:hypothetical protein
MDTDQFATLKAPIPRTMREAKLIVNRVMEDHQMLSISIAGTTEHACRTCDEVWPCKVAKMVGAFLQMSEERDTIWHALHRMADLKEQAYVVWYTWRTMMRTQDRTVKPRQNDWQSMDKRDIDIDVAIWQECTRMVIKLLQNRYELFTDKQEEK